MSSIHHNHDNTNNNTIYDSIDKYQNANNNDLGHSKNEIIFEGWLYTVDNDNNTNQNSKDPNLWTKQWIVISANGRRVTLSCYRYANVRIVVVYFLYVLFYLFIYILFIFIVCRMLFAERYLLSLYFFIYVFMCFMHRIYNT